MQVALERIVQLPTDQADFKRLCAVLRSASLRGALVARQVLLEPANLVVRAPHLLDRSQELPSVLRRIETRPLPVCHAACPSQRVRYFFGAPHDCGPLVLVVLLAHSSSPSSRPSSASSSVLLRPYAAFSRSRIRPTESHERKSSSTRSSTR